MTLWLLCDFGGGPQQEIWQGRTGFRVTEDRGGGGGCHGANELTSLSPHVDQRYRPTTSMCACKMNAWLQEHGRSPHQLLLFPCLQKMKSERDREAL